MLDLFQPTPAKSESHLPRVQVQRHSRRFSVPVLDVPILVDLLAGGVRYPCHLWDVSQHGACLMLRSRVQPGQSVLVRIHAPCGKETVDLEARLMWIDQVMGAFYSGVEFIQPLDLSTTFLGVLIRNYETLNRSTNLVA